MDDQEEYYHKSLPSPPELKFFDTTLDFTIPITSTVPTGGQLALIPQGSTQSKRIGRKCTVRSIQLNMNLFSSWGVNANPNSISAIHLVQDMQCNGAAAAVSAVFDSSDVTVALRNMANNQRFRILKKWKNFWYSMAGQGANYCDIAYNIEWYDKVNITLEFSGATGAITELKSNNLFLIVGMMEAGTLDNVVNVSGKVRIRFTDD